MQNYVPSLEAMTCPEIPGLPWNLGLRKSLRSMSIYVKYSIFLHMKSMTISRPFIFTLKPMYLPPPNLLPTKNLILTEDPNNIFPLWKLLPIQKPFNYIRTFLLWTLYHFLLWTLYHLINTFIVK